jgi:hypothetical protein
MKTTTLRLKHRLNRSRSPLGLLLIPVAFACFTFSPTARAVDPPPDGGYPNANTAEGQDALYFLTTGSNNTAIGADALLENTTGNNNTATGEAALFNNTTGSNNTATGYFTLITNITGSNNTATGVAALAGFEVMSGNRNTANGVDALSHNTRGDNNTATGVEALVHNRIGNSNTANGVDALFTNRSGNNNTATGFNALFSNTGGDNIALGFYSGKDLTTGSNNIDIGNVGVAGESNSIRIGRGGTHTATFIAAISGATVPQGVGVIVDTDGHLGTIVSSERFKDSIKPMDKTSEAILGLQPVTFRYKKDLDPDGIPQFGLVAEEVEKVNRDLVARDEQGKPYTVRYDAVNAMLLNEFLKEHKAFVDAQHKVEKLETTVATLAATVKEQAAQIQKVSVQLEASKPAPQVVNNP